MGAKVLIQNCFDDGRERDRSYYKAKEENFHLFGC
jgi:hypothetical protein